MQEVQLSVIIGARIAYYRKLKKLRQGDLATIVGISVSYVSRIERGYKADGIPLTTYAEIAKALDLNLAKLVDFTDDSLTI